MEITINQLQSNIESWIKTTGVRYFNELTNLAILTEEVGELARVMSRTFGEQSYKDGEKRESLSDELADILWVVVCLANQTGVDLTQAIHDNMAKKTQRDENRHRNNSKLKS